MTAAAVVLIPSADLDASIGFFSTVGFRLDLIAPADDPTHALLSGHGITLRLERGAALPPPVIEIHGTSQIDDSDIEGPDGVVIRHRTVPRSESLPDTDPTFSITHMTDHDWKPGRAGLRYRDLIPDRQGGRFIASHIAVPHGGPVADYVHHHDIVFQIIYCRAGTARLVYEDQGPPFEFGPGDCVLQPPHIRHRVLEASDGFEVIEVSGPSHHPTLVDHELTLPTGPVDPDRDFGGQTFLHHRADQSNWEAFADGFEIDHTGIRGATQGLGDVSVIRGGDRAAALTLSPSGALFLLVVLDGSITLSGESHHNEGAWALESGSAAALPRGATYVVHTSSTDFRMLQVVVA